MPYIIISIIGETADLIEVNGAVYTVLQTNIPIWELAQLLGGN